jgi:hypothetical protein
MVFHSNKYFVNILQCDITCTLPLISLGRKAIKGYDIVLLSHQADPVWGLKQGHKKSYFHGDILLWDKMMSKTLKFCYLSYDNVSTVKTCASYERNNQKTDNWIKKVGDKLCVLCLVCEGMYRLREFKCKMSLVGLSHPWRWRQHTALKCNHSYRPVDKLNITKDLDAHQHWCVNVVSCNVRIKYTALQNKHNATQSMPGRWKCLIILRKLWERKIHLMLQQKEGKETA